MEIEDLYGKTIKFIKTSYSINDGFTVNINNVDVPYPKPNIVPCAGCDIIVDGCSANSESVYEIGGIDCNISSNLKIFECVSIYNYCLPENVDKVKSEHLAKIKSEISKYVTAMEEQINICNKHLNEDTYA